MGLVSVWESGSRSVSWLLNVTKQCNPLAWERGRIQILEVLSSTEQNMFFLQKKRHIVLRNGLATIRTLYNHFHFWNRVGSFALWMTCDMCLEERHCGRRPVILRQRTTSPDKVLACFFVCPKWVSPFVPPSYKYIHCGMDEKQFLGYSPFKLQDILPLTIP